VQVKVVRVDLDARRIDFALVGSASTGPGRKTPIRSNLKGGKIRGGNARNDRSRKVGKKRR